MRSDAPPLLVRRLGRADYAPTADAMRAFTATRGPDAADELWVLEHPPVYTLGVRAPAIGGMHHGIAVVRCERGGSVTYHGPGQAVVYTLVDLARRSLKVRDFVRMLEQSVIDLLAAHGVEGARKADAPGVYVAGAKIAALGLRVSRGRAFHGLSLNVDMDLAPFAAIDPCGFPGLPVTQVRDHGLGGTALEVGEKVAAILAGRLADA
jgi:lipoyl(octanoyl) transferase